MKSRERPSAGVSAMFVGDHRICWRPKYPPAANGCGAVGSVSIALNCAIRSGGPMIWTQPELKPGSAMFSSLKLSSPFSCSQSVPETGSNAIPKLLRSP